ncbi:MAG: DUF433 domain-containing protein [Caldilineaceae bacterium]|nr:DUF433 domain-containing protein [Caldilineaceae bacterium]
MAIKSLDQHIEITPGIVGGKPRIAGHRITVENIVIWHERMGKCVDEIAAEYELSLSDVYAALAYYFDHRAEIDQSMEESEAFVEELRRRTPSKLLEKLQLRAQNGEDWILYRSTRLRGRCEMASLEKS